MNKTLEAQDQAVKELEKIFEQSGFIDWESIRPPTQSKYEKVIQEQTKPIFYRATTPPEAPSAMIKINGSIPRQASLFALYGLVQPDFISADDRIKGVIVQFSITIQYDNKYLFWKNQEGQKNKFINFLSELLDTLEDYNFTFDEVSPEQISENTEGKDTFSFSKYYLISKLY